MSIECSSEDGSSSISSDQNTQELMVSTWSCRSSTRFCDAITMFNLVIAIFLSRMACIACHWKIFQPCPSQILFCGTAVIKHHHHQDIPIPLKMTSKKPLLIKTFQNLCVVSGYPPNLRDLFRIHERLFQVAYLLSHFKIAKPDNFYSFPNF